MHYECVSDLLPSAVQQTPVQQRRTFSQQSHPILLPATRQKSKHSMEKRTTAIALHAVSVRCVIQQQQQQQTEHQPSRTSLSAPRRSCRCCQKGC
eukprot:COSAG01_NODE_489_length_16370_cov_7.973818_17_plen_95_part_00